MHDEMMDPEEIFEKIKSQLCDCPSDQKSPVRLKKFTYILKCKQCGAEGPMQLKDEDEE